ncbi:ribosome silencing factor [Rhodohalobacter barkolensis]|uniref:Ribosomal silencing factor RsfS n=1 Tax=Rhodohalobacter barkolensis TaxID=2053187 RepID=A0A2N0VF97_9BACT|nr:ribosome silencing factor [Rhodohalobacter barkolensis]PKD42871.1 ribosome silencing factor [Rhodohalobacter barkolensis]
MTDTTESTKSQFTKPKTEKPYDTSKLIDAITEGLLEKKAKDIVLLDVRELTTLADYFVVCHGTSDTQIRALANSVEKKVKEELGENVWQQEGKDSRRWVILDYVNVVVHIFTEEKRDYYGIERMWNDAKVTQIEDTVS